MKSGSKSDILTVILYPYERYSSFPAAIDRIYRHARPPFQLIVVEGNAPDALRSEIDERQRQNKNMTVVYTNYYPTACEAVNLALPHVRGHYVFAADNDTVLEPGSLDLMLECARATGAGVVVPSFNETDEAASAVSLIDEPCSFEAGEPKPSIRRFFASLDALHRLGKLDENVCALLADIDLGLMIKAADLEVVHEPRAKAGVAASAPFKAADLKLFEYQWDDDRLEKSRKHLQKKWPLALQGGRCRELIEQHRQVLDRPAGAKALTLMLQNRLDTARRSFKRFFDPILKA